MRNMIFLISVTALAFSCQQSAIVPHEKTEVKDSVIYVHKPEVNIDSIVYAKIDSTQQSFQYLKANNAMLLKRYDSLTLDNNKLAKDLLHSKLVIQNAKYYLNIVNKNPSQQKFLRGWMNRALGQ